MNLRCLAFELLGKFGCALVKLTCWQSTFRSFKSCSLFHFCGPYFALWFNLSVPIRLPFLQWISRVRSSDYLSTSFLILPGFQHAYQNSDSTTRIL